MEDFYISFKENRVIHDEAQFDAESFKTTCPDIYYQIGTRDWHPFTIQVDPHHLEVVWKFYVSHRARQKLLKRRGRSEAFPYLTSVWMRGNEVPVIPEAINSIYRDKSIPSYPIFRNQVEDRANQFKWVANLIAKDLVYSRLIPSQNTSEVPIEGSILRAYIMDHIHISVGEIIPYQFKWKKKKQATVLPFPNLGAIKKALLPTKDKLASLCSTVDVLESKVGALKQEVASLTTPPSTSQPNLCEPEAVPEAPRSPLDDWWIG
ncbi:hypothetical protein HAX54_027551 [Datura stramonium]|uniref:Putative plant transposon protein domain-containing protein n=1 Tax=Datura stramonium TaxID=4076 RepID=A0ABS8V3G8_DATST|nr:hypothetical protein [Datura stramonium]